MYYWVRYIARNSDIYTSTPGLFNERGVRAKRGAKLLMVALLKSNLREKINQCSSCNALLVISCLQHILMIFISTAGLLKALLNFSGMSILYSQGLLLKWAIAKYCQIRRDVRLGYILN